MAIIWHTRAIDAGRAPSAVRLFVAGKNSSTKGDVIFDAAAARQVIACADSHGVDVMIDLEHLSLDSESRAFDPDARGWGRLAVRNGSLWLVDIKWTRDGATRLRDKRQRYVSPAFSVDPKTSRVTRILNVAITALPATDHAMPLVAANGRNQTMDPEQIKAALDALIAGDAAAALEILKALIASAATGGGEAAEEMPTLAEGEPGDEDQMLADGDEKTDEEQLAEDDEMIAAAARAVTGKRKAGEVRAALRGMREGRNSASTYGAELQTLRETVLRGQLRDIVRDNPTKIASKKLEHLVLASESVETAQALVDALPASYAPPVRQRDRDAAPSAVVKLTDEDKEVARLTGTNPVDLLAFKRTKAGA